MPSPLHELFAARHGIPPRSNKRLIGLGLAVALATVGCKPMTEARRRHESAKAPEESVVQAAEEEAQQLQENVQKEKSELERKKAELERKLEREARTKEAAVAIQSGDAQTALAIAEELLDLPDADAGSSDAPTIADFSADSADDEAELPPLEVSDAERARLWVIKGTALYELGDEEGALAAYAEASRLDPDHRTARRNLGKLLFREGRFEEALAAWEKELQDGYRDADLLYLVGQARYEVGTANGKTGDLEAAKVAMRQVLVERPGDADVRRWLAMLEYETESWREAIRLFRLILAEQPLDAAYLELLASSHIQVGEHDKAIDVLELAVRVGAPRSELLQTLGQLYATRGLPGNAAEWLSRAYEDDPPRAPSEERLRIGMLWAEAEDAERAIRWLSSLRPTDRDYADSQARLAYLHGSRGQTDEALAAFERIRDSDTYACMANLAAGDIYLERKRLDEAQEAFSKASALGDDCKPDGLAGLAEVAYSRDNLEHAARLYRQALESRPKDPRFRAALTEIEAEIRVREQLRAVDDAVAQREVAQP